jgi:hypothetical protein
MSWVACLEQLDWFDTHLGVELSDSGEDSSLLVSVCPNVNGATLVVVRVFAVATANTAVLRVFVDGTWCATC